MKLRALFVVLLMFACSSVFGYKPEKHRDYVLDSIDFYQQCPNSMIDRSSIVGIAIGAYNEDESEFLSRARNWHFFNRDEQLKNRILYNESLDIIFDARIAELEQAIQAGKPYEDAAGRVLHYIQDMSVPAHVVPIFHPKYVLWGDDEFDGYQYSTVNNQFNEITITCKAVESFPFLLKSAANHTLDMINTKLINRRGIELPITWNLFWSKQDTSERFGDYGLKFGETTRIDSVASACVNGGCLITTDYYHFFYEQQYMEVIKNTIIFLKTLECLLYESDTADGCNL